MTRIKDLIKSVSARPTLVIHLGAGTCSEYESYKAINSSRVIYVEPEQHLAEAAIDTFSNNSDVKIIPFAIAAENGLQTLNITNNRRFSSLLLPGELLDFYPNIEVEDKTEVKAITLSRLCQDEAVSKDSDNLLVAELQGMEKEVFSLARIETLQHFKWIIIRSSEAGLYTPFSENPKSSLTEVLQNAGFMVLVFEEDTPPFINFLCIRNDAGIENIRLRANEDSLLDKNRVLDQALTQQKTNLADLQSSHATSVAELQNSVDSTSSELVKTQSRIQTLTDENDKLQQQVSELSKTINAKKVEIDKTQALVHSMTDHKELHREQFKDLSKAADAKSVKLDKAVSLVQSLTSEKENQQQRVNELSKTIDANSVKLDKAVSLVQSLTSERKKQQQQVKDLSKTIDAKSSELNQAQALIQSGTKKTEAHERQLTRLRNTVKEKEKEITGIQQTLRVNSKLILKTDADLRDLQLQYRAALHHQEQQHILLYELKGKLHQASKFYQKLNLQNLVLDADLLEQSDADPGESHGGEKD